MQAGFITLKMKKWGIDATIVIILMDFDSIKNEMDDMDINSPHLIQEKFCSSALGP